MRLAVPVDPDAPTARELLLQELANPRYRSASSGWFDDLLSRFVEWLKSLLGAAPTGSPTVILVVLALLGAAALGVAYLIFGPPRLGRRRTTATLFGATDSRDAAELRRSARDAADNGNWPVAIEEAFRAIALACAERAIFSISPGTTAAGFARRASDYFPRAADRLTAAGQIFDAVRYLNQPGSAADYRDLAALDDELRTSPVDFAADFAAGFAAAETSR